MLFRQSFSLLKKDKEVMLFPLLSFIVGAIILILLILASIFIFDITKDEEVTLSTSWYAYLITTYLLTIFTTSYFQAGLVTIINARINGQDKVFSDGIHNANAHIGKIFIWSLVSATIGVILQAISEKSEWLGKLVTSLVGTAWGIVTMFIIPVLILDKLSIIDSIKQSGSIFKKTWGETILMNFGVGLALIPAFLLVIVITMVGILTTGYVIVFVLFTIISFLLLGVVSNTLSSIFKVVLFHYATTGKVAEGFDNDLVMGAIKGK